MYCQKCRSPLKLDGSLEGLNPAAYDLLVATHSQQPPRRPPSRVLHSQDRARRSHYDHISQGASQAAFRRHSGPGRGDGHQKLPRDSSAMSFVLLTESQFALPSGASQRAAHDPYQQRGSQGASSALQQTGAHDGAADHHAADMAGTQSHEMERITKLFEILSARSDIDHPICVECADMLVDEMQKRLETASRERDAYAAFLKAQTGNAVPTDDEIQAHEEALRRTRQEEAAAHEQLLQLEHERAQLEAELLSLEHETAKLDAREEEFWRERNAFAGKLADFQNERDSVNSRFDHDARLLEKLQRSNVYNDTFCISHDGNFATINGLRLGRLPSRPVDWPEINAAWGHALLLLVTVADKLAYRFDGYDLQPMGSASRIIRFDPLSPVSSRVHHSNSPRGQLGGSGRGTPVSAGPPPPPPPPQPAKRHLLDLYSSGDMPLGLTFMHRNFNSAMVAFLELVRQLGVHVHRQTALGGTPLSLPYRIEADRISDVSIKLGIGSDESWTKACKLTLTCCKFLLAHASNVSAVSNARVAGV